MCNRWQKESNIEISLSTIRQVFTNDLFSKVEDVNLHGGEPTLRTDLADICKIIQDSCPKLQRMWISTNGFSSKRVGKRIIEVLNLLDFKKLKSLEINVSIDGIDEIHDKIRGVKGGFKQCLETIGILKQLSKNYPLRITIGTVIQPKNLNQLDEIEHLADNLNVPILYQPLMFDTFFNIGQNQKLQFSKEDKKIFHEKIEEKLLSGSSPTNFYWHDFLSIMGGENRKSPCAFDRYVFSLYPTGEVLPCSREDWMVFGNIYNESPEKIWFNKKSKALRSRMRKDVCKTCSSYCGVEFALQQEFFTYPRFYLKKKLFGSKFSK